MNAGRFVGRVGGLAVVLGVGVVMTFGASSRKGIGLKRARLDSARSGSKGGNRSLMSAGIRGFGGAG